MFSIVSHLNGEEARAARGSELRFKGYVRMAFFKSGRYPSQTSSPHKTAWSSALVYGPPFKLIYGLENTESARNHIRNVRRGACLIALDPTRAVISPQLIHDLCQDAVDQVTH